MKNTTVQRITTFIRYLILIVLMVSLVGLAWWYFFLRSKTATIVTSDIARGFGVSAPTFEGETGSTYQNILSDKGSSTSTQSFSVHGKPPQLWNVTPSPVAGMGFVKNGTSTVMYFVERATGYIFSANVETGELVRITHTLRPKIYEAFFTKDGSVVERSLDEAGNITTFAGILPTTASHDSTTTTEALLGKTLEQNIISIAVHPTVPEIFYTTIDAKTGLIGVRAQWNGSKAKHIFSSTMLGWRMLWLQDGRLILTQNAADAVVGYSYELSQAGVLTPLVGNIAGLTVLPRTSSTAVVYGASYGTPSLFVKVDQKTPAVQLPLKTLADKCVWAPPRTVGKTVDVDLIAYCAVPQTLPPTDFLNQWYRGVVHTEDSWWRVDATTGTVRELFVPSNTARLDVDHPTMDEGGNYIAFINAADKSLWLLRLDLGGSATSTKRS